MCQRLAALEFAFSKSVAGINNSKLLQEMITDVDRSFLGFGYYENSPENATLRLFSPKEIVEHGRAGWARS